MLLPQTNCSIYSLHSLADTNNNNLKKDRIKLSVGIGNCVYNYARHRSPTQSLSPIQADVHRTLAVPINYTPMCPSVVTSRLLRHQRLSTPAKSAAAADINDVDDAHAQPAMRTTQIN